MQVTTAIAIYFLIWWLMLFAVLPWGVRSQGEGGDKIARGTDPGAPVIARVWWKLLWTTILSGVVFAILYVIYTNKLISFDDISSIYRMPR